MGSTESEKVTPAATGLTSRPTRVPKPNYNQIHALPLPLEVFPLPPLVPHNPLSILHIAFTYILHFIAPPSSHPQALYQGIFSPETRSVHVTDVDTVRILWERGFFGKGSLSRSEPSWLEREKRRKGIVVGETSEEVTRRRREERREFKKERARKEREAIEGRLLEEGGNKLHAEVETNEDAHHELENDASFADRHSPQAINHKCSKNTSVRVNEVKNCSRTDFHSVSHATLNSNLQNSLENPHPVHDQAAEEMVNQEHLQLTLEEAFFLAYGLGVLEVRTPDKFSIMSIESLFSLCREHSYFPPCSHEQTRPDDPFLLSYVVYHHFRSLGWVVRPGIKFAVDYLLYNRGPVFSHAEFAVIILPSYSHPYWRSTAQLAEHTKKKESKSWCWLHCVNRVQSQVRKSLVLVYVEIPPDLSSPSPTLKTSKSSKASSSTQQDSPSPQGSLLLSSMSTVKDEVGFKEIAQKGAGINISQLLKRYKVRELALKRWIPNRSRD
ncbi:hypothetical protein MMC12_001273 [Toensbergia leucococca]|nr:hypothetical protein [Toensbergia leucococca]